MNRPLVLALALATAGATPLAAGDLHGKVTCKGLRNSARYQPLSIMRRRAMGG